MASQIVHHLSKRLQAAISPSVCQALTQQGYAFVDGLFGEHTRALRSEIVGLYQGGLMHKNSTHLVQGAQRSYVVKSHIYEAELTLDPKVWRRAPLCHHLEQDRTLATMLSLQSSTLRLDSQAIKLQYNAGSGGCFPLHLDTDAAVDGRKVTAIFYLNPSWTEDHGGLLKLYPWPSPPVSLEPHNDRLVLFSSARMLHRVTPSFARTPASDTPGQDKDTQNRCCFTIWLSQDRARSRPGPSRPLSSLQPTTSPEEDPLVAARFLMQPTVRPHAMKLVYAEEWEQSLRESHPEGPELDALLELHRQEVDKIRRALARYLGVIDRLGKDPHFAAQVSGSVQWF